MSHNSEIALLSNSSAVVAWTSLAVIASATLTPFRDRTQPASSAEIERLAAFPFLGLAFSATYLKRMRFVCSLVLGSAVAFEFLQMLLPDRHGRLIDVSEKICWRIAGDFGKSRCVVLERWANSSKSNSSPQFPN